MFHNQIFHKYLLKYLGILEILYQFMLFSKQVITFEMWNVYACIPHPAPSVFEYIVYVLLHFSH